jgi:hypothetical protein
MNTFLFEYSAKVIPLFHSILNNKSTIGGIKYKKSTIRNQSIIQKYFSSPMVPHRWKMNNQHVKKKVVFFKTSQLNNGGFAYI